MWWFAVAMAQDVVVEDFTGPTLGWTLGPGTSFGVPPNPWAGAALVCDVGALYGTCEAGSAAFVVTHDTFGWRSTAEVDLGVGTLVLTLSDGSPPTIEAVRAVPGTWGLTEVAIAGACGLSGTVDLSATSGALAVAPPVVYFDDLTLTGGVCSQFVDGDTDGACLQGTDLDGDGLCITPGEAAEPGVIVDPDEGGTDTGTVDTSDPPDTAGDTAAPPVDSAEPPEDTGPSTDTGTPGETKDTSDTGAPTTPTTEPPIHTGQAPVHDPFEDDTGGVVVKEGGGCGCATSGPSGAAVFGAVLVLGRVRRRRAE